METGEQLERIAQKLLWWQPPETSVQDARRLVAQIMNLGTWEDVKFAQEYFGVAAFRDALEHAQPGWFEQSSWALWHHAFELPVPALPRRRCLEGEAPMRWRGK